MPGSIFLLTAGSYLGRHHNQPIAWNFFSRFRILPGQSFSWSIRRTIETGQDYAAAFLLALRKISRSFWPTISSSPS